MTLVGLYLALAVPAGVFHGWLHLEHQPSGYWMLSSVTTVSNVITTTLAAVVCGLF